MFHIVKKFIVLSFVLLAVSCAKTSFVVQERGSADVFSRKETPRNITTKSPSSPEPKVASQVISAACPTSASFLIRVDLDGVAAYEKGSISRGKGYLDFFGVSLSEKFFLPPACREFVSVSEVPFPERVRFIISNPLIDSMKASSEESSVIISRAENPEKLYILKVLDSHEGYVQTIKIFASSSVEPRANELTGVGYTVTLGKKFNSVSGLPQITMLSGPAFSSMQIDDRGEETMLFFKTPSPATDIDVYTEKTSYGFVVYARKLR